MPLGVRLQLEKLLFFARWLLIPFTVLTTLKKISMILSCFTLSNAALQLSGARVKMIMLRRSSSRPHETAYRPARPRGNAP